MGNQTRGTMENRVISSTAKKVYPTMNKWSEFKEKEID
jgi:hypothetical protein